MHDHAHAVARNLLGPYTSHVSGSHPYVERITAQGFDKLHLGVAHSLWSTGINSADAVAAIPSLHVGGTVLFCLFMWKRLSRYWRPFLLAYPFAMQFSLSYGGEHYVVDGVAGALSAFAVHALATRIEQRWRSILARRSGVVGARGLRSATPLLVNRRSRLLMVVTTLFVVSAYGFGIFMLARPAGPTANTHGKRCVTEVNQKTKTKTKICTTPRFSTIPDGEGR
jgi:hypothetical protein